MRTVLQFTMAFYALLDMSKICAFKNLNVSNAEHPPLSGISRVYAQPCSLLPCTL